VRPVVADVADQAVGRNHAHTLRLVRTQEVERRSGLVVVVQPAVEVPGVEYDGHAVMDRLRELIRLRGDDGKGIDRRVHVSLAWTPFGEQACEGVWLPVWHLEAIDGPLARLRLGDLPGCRGDVSEESALPWLDRRRLGQGGSLHPLIKTVGGDEATAMQERTSPDGLVEDRRGPGVALV
jgi:hypothetical protein